MVTLKEKPLALGAEEEARVLNNKIIVTGIERVGVACVFSILGKSLADELALADVLEEKLKVAMMPLQHESLCLQTPRFVADTESVCFSLPRYVNLGSQKQSLSLA
uniref:L-lactate dehydrogenase B chain n=1 Tax=Sus scrofa TaxID=9823 RepID=A0A8D0SMA4_PIG